MANGSGFYVVVFFVLLWGGAHGMASLMMGRYNYGALSISHGLTWHVTRG